MANPVERLGESGKAIWEALGAANQPAAARSLILEYARLADTADRLADLAAGRKETWASLIYDEMGEVHLAVDKLLAEQRNTQLAIKQIHGELRMAGLLVAASPVALTATSAEETPLERRRREKAERERAHG